MLPNKVDAAEPVCRRPPARATIHKRYRRLVLGPGVVPYVLLVSNAEVQVREDGIEHVGHCHSVRVYGLDGPHNAGDSELQALHGGIRRWLRQGAGRAVGT